MARRSRRRAELGDTTRLGARRLSIATGGSGGVHQVYGGGVAEIPLANGHAWQARIVIGIAALPLLWLEPTVTSRS
jgi:hypothetical protein